MSNERNPLFIPEGKPAGAARGCPKCGQNDYLGRRAGSLIITTCQVCRNEWYGQVPPVVDDRTPRNPANVPIVSSFKDSKGQIHERINHPNPSPDFRRGAVVPNEDE